MDEHAVDAQCDARDDVSAQHLHTRWTCKRVLAVVIAAIIGGLLLGMDIPWAFIAGAGFLGGVIGGGVGHEVVRRLILPARARRVFAQQKNLHSPIRFSWDETGLACFAPTGNSKTPWTDYLKQRENARVILLYHSEVFFQMLPKRAFQSEAQLASFRTASRAVPHA